MPGRGLPVILAAALVPMLLLVTFDLDRPTRGLITVPSMPLASLRASMALPPARAAVTVANLAVTAWSPDSESDAFAC